MRFSARQVYNSTCSLGDVIGFLLQICLVPFQEVKISNGQSGCSLGSGLALLFLSSYVAQCSHEHA